MMSTASSSVSPAPWVFFFISFLLALHYSPLREGQGTVCQCTCRQIDDLVGSRGGCRNDDFNGVWGETCTLSMCAGLSRSTDTMSCLFPRSKRKALGPR
uniref:Putative secreted protein n=1 Tax=Ixodes ricinus TaxID=34613 RepID=A0A6B0UGG3_IXORI